MCMEGGKHLQLRIFHPALVRYCLQGDMQAVKDIDNMIAQQVRVRVHTARLRARTVVRTFAYVLPCAARI